MERPAGPTPRPLAPAAELRKISDAATSGEGTAANTRRGSAGSTASAAAPDGPLSVHARPAEAVRLGRTGRRRQRTAPRRAALFIRPVSYRALSENCFVDWPRAYGDSPLAKGVRRDPAVSTGEIDRTRRV